MINKFSHPGQTGSISYGKILSYIIFVAWTVITVLPLFWMTYSSFKTNAELTQNIFKLPSELISNNDIQYKITDYPYLGNPNDKRERVTLESISIRGFRHFILHSKLPQSILSRKVGDNISLSELPLSVRTDIRIKTIFYNYISAWNKGRLGPKMMNSLIYVLVSTTAVIMFSMMASYGFSKIRIEPYSSILSTMIGIGYLISIPAIIIPLFIMLNSLNLTDSHLGIILVYTAFGLPLGVMLGQNYVHSIPDSLIESAHIDGAGHWKTFLSIVLPMSNPVIITILIINVLGIWNEFLLVLVIASSEATKSLPVGVFSFSSQTSTELGWQLAALVIAVVPTVLTYFIFNKSITKGVATGAIKG